MRILFISRAFPPIVGGIEKQNYEISRALAKHVNVVPIVNRRGKKYLPVFLVFAVIAMIRNRKDCDAILLGDGVMAIAAWLVRIFSTKPVIAILHGLDVTYGNFLYQTLWVRLFFRAIDHFIAVGNETINQAESRGIRRDNLTYIPNGVETDLPIRKYSRQDLSRLLGFVPEGPVLLTLGRLVKRKGVAWFICNVMPLLDDAVVYVVAGKGPEESNIKRTIDEAGMAARVVFLGAVTEEAKETLLSVADLFVQPNVSVENDMEGFGLVVLEAAMHETYVVASRLEGLKDAISENRNGSLVDAGDAQAYNATIRGLLQDPDRLREKSANAREFVAARYDWNKIAGQYAQVISSFIPDE